MKVIIAVLEKCLWLILSPMFLRLSIARKEEDRELQFRLFSEFLSLWPFQIGMLARRVYYKQTLQKCGENPVIHIGTIFIHAHTEIGNDVLLGNYCVIGLATIGDDVMLANNVSLLSGRHHHLPDNNSRTNLFRLMESKISRIYVGNNVWIGANATIMANVNENSIVGAGAVVVNPVPASSVAAGNPSRVIRKIDI